MKLSEAILLGAEGMGHCTEGNLFCFQVNYDGDDTSYEMVGVCALGAAYIATFTNYLEAFDGDTNLFYHEARFRPSTFYRQLRDCYPEINTSINVQGNDNYEDFVSLEEYIIRENDIYDKSLAEISEDLKERGF